MQITCIPTTFEEYVTYEEQLTRDHLVVNIDEYVDEKVRNATQYYFKAVDENGTLLGFSAFAHIIHDAFNEFYHRGLWVVPEYRKQGVRPALFARKLQCVLDNALDDKPINFHTFASPSDDHRYPHWVEWNFTKQKTVDGLIDRTWRCISHEAILKYYNMQPRPFRVELSSETVSHKTAVSNHQYTKDNHFVFGYNNDPFSERTCLEDEWFVRYGRISYKPKSLRQEAIAAAKHIRDVNTGPIDVTFSGGSDSEMVVRAFHDAKIPFRCHILRFNNMINFHDVAYAQVVCDTLGIKPIFHDLDLLAFYESGEYRRFSKLSNCTSAMLLPTMWLMNRCDGVPVLGSGECYTARTDTTELLRIKKWTAENYPTDSKWVMYEREGIASWYRFPMRLNRPAVPGFFQYTPELMYVVLTNKINQDLHANKRRGRLSNKSSKMKAYQEAYPDMLDRPKFHGYENVPYYAKGYGISCRRGDLEDNQNFMSEYWSETGALISYLEGNGEFPPNLRPMIKGSEHVYTKPW